jgi:hypothetical protein
MIIKYNAKDPTGQYALLNIYPNIFLSEKEKLSKAEIKHTLDYFQNVAYSQFVKNKDTYIRNYELLKGKLRPEDFYEANEQVRSFLDVLNASENELPSYVQHYSILNNPINEMVGEATKRPDISKVKAVDDESKSEELQYKTEILQQFITQRARAIIEAKLGAGGEEVDAELVEQLTAEKVEEYMTGYTSLAERWGNNMLEALKVQFNIKEKSEDSFRDLLITAREFHHIYEDNSKTGFGYEVLNPKNVWHLTTPDKKYTKDSFAAGCIHVMELSEIIDRFDLSKEEIDHLRDLGQQSMTLFSPRESNLTTGAEGQDSITYDTYSRLIQQERLFIEAQLRENSDPLSDFMGISSNVNTFGYKYMVLQAYWISKKKIAKVTYFDESGEEQVTLVDGDEYQPIPNQISVEYGYINQWWKGYKIGRDIYHVEPLKILETCPIIGVVHEIKNTEPKSLVDLMKPFQMIYNVAMNQLWKLLEKEVGVVGVVQLRRIPRVKDGDGQDDIDAWEMEARERGVMFEDDSPENTKVPLPNTSATRVVDLSRTAEMQTRYQLAVQMKYECWELVGFTRERFGQSIGSSQTATSIQNAVSRSYAQTEPYFVQHEYVMNEVYQTLLDCALAIESQKPTSTISFINSEGTSAFVSVNGSELSYRELKCFVSSRAEDHKIFEELRQLAQPMLQNGADIYDVAVLYSMNSIRQMKDTFRRVQKRKEELIAQQQQAQQQEIQNNMDSVQMQLMADAEERQKDREFEAFQNELDRLNKKEVALINQLGRNENATADNNNDGIADALETVRLTNEIENTNKEYNLKLQEMQQKSKEQSDKIRLELEKIKVARENMKNDLQIANIQAKAKAKANKSKPKK